jgi:hypothetical protein
MTWHTFALVLMLSALCSGFGIPSTEKQNLGAPNALWGDSLYSSSQFRYGLSAPSGCTIESDLDGELLTISCNSTKHVDVILLTMDDYDRREAAEYDSSNLVRGFVCARMMYGLAYEGDGETCLTLNILDSLLEFRNHLGVNVYIASARMRLICRFDSNKAPDTSFYPYRGYFVDISQGNSIRLLQIPNSLDELKDREVSRVSVELLDRIFLLRPRH